MLNKIFKIGGQLCILSTIVLGPWCDGGTAPECLQLFLFLIFASSGCTLAFLWTCPKQIRQKFSLFPVLTMSIPIFLELGICVFQLVPLSDTMLGRCSPHLLELRNQLCSIDSSIKLSQMKEKSNNRFWGMNEFAQIEQIRSYLGRIFAYEKGCSFDLERALLVDRAVENEFIDSENHQLANLWGRCVSLYPLATRRTIPLFVGAFIIFLTSSVLFNVSKERVFFFKIVSLIGGVYALLCIATRTNTNGIRQGILKPLWDNFFVPGEFGTYVNKNAAGGYLVLVFVICLGGVIYELFKSVSKVGKENIFIAHNLKRCWAYNGGYNSRWKIFLGNLFNLFNRDLLCAVSITAVVYVAILISLSRGAIIAATVAFVLVCFVLAIKKETRRYWYIFAVTVIVSLLILFAMRMYSEVDNRMGTLVRLDEFGNTAITNDLRLENWYGALNSSKNYKWLGAGLGTYGLANMTNDLALKHNKLFYYAENIFVQTRLELGRLGLVLLIVGYFLLLWLFGKNLMGRHSFETFALALTSATLVISQILSASTDFGNYLPANLILFATICGVALGRQNEKIWKKLNYEIAKTNDLPKVIRKIEIVNRRVTIGLILLSVELIGGMACSQWILSENRDCITRTCLVKAVDDLPEDKLGFMSAEALDGLIKRFENFITKRDDSFEVRERLSQLYAWKTRLYIFSTMKEQNKIKDYEKLWDETALENYFLSLLKYQSLGFDVPVESVREKKEISKILMRVVSNQFVARRICPLFVHVNRNLIIPLVLSSNISWSDERNLMELYARRIASTMPFSTQEMFKNGCYLTFFKLDDLAKAFLSRSLFLHLGTNVEKIIKILITNTKPSSLGQILNDVLPNDPFVACISIQIARRLTKDSLIYNILKDKAECILDKIPEVERDARYYFYVASYAIELEAYSVADCNLCKAIELAPDNQLYCLKRAQLLTKYSNVIGKEEECVNFIQGILPKMSGVRLWECDKLLLVAKKNLRDYQIRQEALIRVRREQNLDEYFKK